MRFGIRDLMLLTGFVTIYMVVFTVSPTGSWNLLDVGVFLGPMIVVPFIAAYWWVARRRVGRVLYGVRSPRFWTTQYGLAVLSLAIAIVIRTQGIPFPKPALGQILAMHVMFLSFQSGIRFGQNGVVSGIAFMSWEDYRFHLQHSRLHWSYIGLRPRLSQTQGNIPVPPAEAEAIRAILADKQGKKTEPPMDADQHG